MILNYGICDEIYKLFPNLGEINDLFKEQLEIEYLKELKEMEGEKKEAIKGKKSASIPKTENQAPPSLNLLIKKKEETKLKIAEKNKEIITTGNPKENQEENKNIITTKKNNEEEEEENLSLIKLQPKKSENKEFSKEMILKKKLEEKYSTNSVLEYFKKFITDDVVETKIWGTVNLNNFLKYAHFSAIKDLCTNILKNNNYLLEKMGLKKIGALWKNFYLNSKDLTSSQTDIIISVLNTLYENISTQNEGFALNTYLKYDLNMKWIKMGVVKFCKGEQDDSKILQIVGNEDIKIDLIDKDLDEEKLKMQKIMENLLMLTYHIMRNSSCFLKFQNTSDEPYEIALHIVKNDFNIKWKAKSLEYIYALYFANQFTWPSNVICQDKELGDPEVNLGKKIQDMDNLFEQFSKCKDNQLVKNYSLLKIIIQKKLFFYGNEKSPFFLEKILVLIIIIKIILNIYL